MAICPGARLGLYEILSSVGAGGMAEVCRARDTRLDPIVSSSGLRSVWVETENGGGCT